MGPYCELCTTTHNLVHELLNHKYLCADCAPKADTTFCGVCGIIGFRADLVFASNGDGPHCSGCLPLVEAEILAAEDWDDGHWNDDWPGAWHSRVNRLEDEDAEY